MVTLTILLFSCATTYKSQYGGKEDKAYILVLSADDGRSFSDISIEVDGKIYPVDKVYTEKKYQKATPIAVYAGKRKVKIQNGSEVLLIQTIFVGVQETRKIIIR